MTVKELRDALAAFDDQLEVVTEGCDCLGDVSTLVIWSERVVLCRENGNLEVLVPL